MPAGHNNDGALVGIEIRAPRPRPPPKKQSKSKSKSHRSNAGHKSRAGGNGKSRRDIEIGAELSVIKTFADVKYQKEVLASVGLDGDDGDNAEYGIVDDLDNVLSLKNPHRGQKQHKNNKKKSSSSKGNGCNRTPKKASKQMMKQTQPDYDPTFDFDNDPEYDEYHDDDVEEDEELLNEELTFDQSLANQQTSATRCATAKPYFTRLLYLMVATALVGYIFYDDDMLEGEEVDEDVTAKKEPYSYKGYKDERIPDDDIAQYGGGLIGAEIFGRNETNDEDEDEDDSKEEEYHVPDNYFSESFHDPSGIFQVDHLWEELTGYAEMRQPFNAQQDLPVFWHIPKCGGTTLQDLMMHCMGMVGAYEVGGQYAKEYGVPLEVVKLENGNRYVNVDMSKPEGISHAKDAGFGSSELANVVMTAWFPNTASVFDDNKHKGRCFTIMRHPIERAISMFYYLKDATWEQTFSEVYKTMTIEEYATSQYAEDNWMTRFLTNEMTGGVFERHLDLAKEVLESKCLVGIMEDFKGSFNRFNKYFGWQNVDFHGPVSLLNRGTCVNRVMSHPDNSHQHPKHEEGSEVWNLLMQKNQYDVQLYEHAVKLYMTQA